MRPEHDLVVIGGGAGGLVVAAGGAALGARVALVEKHRLGGDCLWTGCVPSKALLKSARLAHDMHTAERRGLRAADPQPELPRVMQHVAHVIGEIAPHDSPERFRALGIDVILGEGRFESPAAFRVGERTLTARAFVLATGSRPAIPPIPGLSDAPFLTSESVFDLREPVPSLVVLGAGPIGCELAQGFARLGSEVTLIDLAAHVLPREDADLANVVEQRLRSEGVQMRLGVRIEAVERKERGIELDLGSERVRASHLLVALGRTASTAGLDLAAGGVEVRDGRIVLDAHLRTTNRRVFAIGDVAGGHQFTHVAEHHAGIVLRQALLPFARLVPSKIVPWCTFTDPELARVGMSETEANAAGTAHEVYRFAVEENDRAHTDGETAGFAKLLTDRSGRILGAAIVGAHAGDLIAEYALAMQHGLRASALSATIHPYPTWVQTNRRLADQRLKAALTPARRVWLKRVLRLRGI
jgi:pyruvate/2-oxoglutarate dehydrogenase complex dihydrolipoamide dehydrogenase (E3) component